MVSSSLFWEVHLLKKIPLTPKPFWECIPWVILGIYVLVMVGVVAVLTYSNHFLTCFYMLEQQRILSVITLWYWFGSFTPSCFPTSKLRKIRPGTVSDSATPFIAFYFSPLQPLDILRSPTPASLQTSFAIRNKAPDRWFFKQHWETSHGDTPILITHINKVQTNSDAPMKIQALQSSLLLGATQDTSKTWAVSTFTGLDTAWHYVIPPATGRMGPGNCTSGVNWASMGSTGWLCLDF